MRRRTVEDDDHVYVPATQGGNHLSMMSHVL